MRSFVMEKMLKLNEPAFPIELHSSPPFPRRNRVGRRLLSAVAKIGENPSDRLELLF